MMIDLVSKTVFVSRKRGRGLPAFNMSQANVFPSTSSHRFFRLFIHSCLLNCISAGTLPGTMVIALHYWTAGANYPAHEHLGLQIQVSNRCLDHAFRTLYIDIFTFHLLAVETG